MKTLTRPAMFALAAATLLAGHAQAAPAAPDKGDAAPTVEVPGLDGQPVDLAETFAEGDTVLVVLRGFPGYQCGICSRQATAILAAADRFAEAGLRVVMVYPGPSTGLEGKANEFLGGKTLPAPISMVLDPDYKLVNAYGIRWDAPRETAYPATFLIEQGGQVAWAKVSQSHGGRTSVDAILEAAK